MEPPNYEYRCIYCQSTNVIPLINDGGSIQQCNSCDKSYRAKILAAPEPIDQSFFDKPRKRHAWIKNNNGSYDHYIEEVKNSK